MSTSAGRIIKGALPKGGEHIGTLVGVEVDIGTRLIDRREVRRLLAEHGLPVDIQANDVSAQHAFGRALNAFADHDFVFNRPRPRSRDAILQVRAKDAWPVIADVCIGGNPGAEVIEVKPRTHPNGSPVWPWGAAEEKAIGELRASYARFRNFIDGQEFRRTVNDALIAWFGGLRVTLGYWMPPASHVDVEAFGRVVESVGGCVIDVMPIHDSPQSRSTAGRGVHDTLGRELATVMDELREYAAEIDSVRESTIEERITRIADLESRVNVFEYVLGERAAQLRAALTDAQGKAKQLLAGDVSWYDAA